MIVYLEKKPFNTKEADFTKWPYCFFSKGVPNDCVKKLEITPWFVLKQKQA